MKKRILREDMDFGARVYHDKEGVYVCNGSCKGRYDCESCKVVDLETGEY